MKAWQYDAFGGKLEDTLFLNNSARRPRTSLLPDEILVHVISAGLNPVDFKVAEMRVARLAISVPATPGTDYCGRVVATGTAIDSIRNGELVFGKLKRPSQFGTLGEYVVVTLSGCIPLPANVEIDHAAAIGVAGLTAYQCIQPNVKKGSKVFINGGSGGTGSFGIQFAKVLGCSVTVSCSTANIALCKELGADEVIDYKVSDITEKLKVEGLVYDLVVDNVGEPHNLYVEATRFLKESGKFVQVGASMAQAGSVMSRMLKPSFLGGGTRKYQLLSMSEDPNTLSQIAQVLFANCEFLPCSSLTALVDRDWQGEGRH